MKLFKKYFIGVLFLFIILGFFGFIDKTEAAPIDFIWGNATPPPADCDLIDVRFDLNKEEYAPNEDIVATMEIIDVRNCLGQGIAIKVKKYYGGSYVEEGLMTVDYASNGETASFTFGGEPDHQSGSYIEVFRKVVCNPGCNEYPYNPKVFKSLNIGSVLLPPSVNNLNHTSLTDTSVTLGANITSVGISGDTITNRGFCYSKHNSMPTFPAFAGDTCVNAIGAPSAPWTGPFTANLSNLTTNTLYYYSAYATNSARTGYAYMGQFTTYLAPTISSPTATDITSSSAKLGATITSIGHPTYLIRRGFCVASGPNPGFSYPDYPNGTPWVTCHDVTGSAVPETFNFTKTGLGFNTPYNYRGYVETPAGVRYTNNATFTTNPLTVTLSKQENKEKNVVKAGVMTEVGTVHFQYNLSGKPADVNCKLKNLKNNNESVNLIEGIENPVNSNDLDPNQNNFRIECKSGETLVKASDPVSAAGQSGTMNSPANCVIPINESSCPISIPWTVNSPRGTDPTLIKVQIQGAGNPIEKYNSATAGVPNTGATASITLNGSDYMVSGQSSRGLTFSLWNKVDGDNSSSSVDNQILPKSVTMVCESGTWITNKCVAAAVTGPDLIVIPPFTPLSVVKNTSATLGVVVKNNGNATTGSGFDNFFQYSTSAVDPNLGGAPENTIFDLPAVSFSTALGAGAQRGLTYSTTTTIFNTLGIYWIRACADKAHRDDDGDIDELNEINNCGDWWPLNVVSGPQPDLVAHATNVTGNTGRIRTFQTPIQNIGNATTGTGFWNFFQQSTMNPSGGFLPEEAVYDITPPKQVSNPLLSGNQVSISYSNYDFVNDGIYWIRACADKMNRDDPGMIDNELSEINNCGSWKQVIIGTNPVVNGRCSEPAIHFNCLSGTSANPNIYPHQYTWDCLGSNGGYNSPLCVEPRGAMFGDLIPQAESCAIEEGRDSCMIKFDWLVTNPVGGTSVTNSSGVPVGSGNPGKDVEFPVKYNQESFELKNDGKILDKEIVNSYCALTTSWNGTICATIVPPLQPDLEAEPPIPTSDIPAKVAREYTANIVNKGDGPVLFGFNNLFQTATDKNDESTIMDHTADNTLGPLGAGGDSAIARVTITFDQQGTYEMRACADKKNKNDAGGILESNEDNNCSAWVTVNVLAPQKPDLVASFIGPRSIEASEEKVNFRAVITNQGHSATNYEGQDSFTNLFQIGKKSAKTETGTKEEVGSGMELEPSVDELGISVLSEIKDAGIGNLGAFVSIPTSIGYVFETAGTYYMRTCADKNSAGDSGVINESNEDNNCSDPWTPITVVAEGTPLPGLCSDPLVQNECSAGEVDGEYEDEYNYFWNCMGINGGGYAECLVPKAGGSGISIQFEASPTRILSGRKSTLSWEVSGGAANYCELTGGDIAPMRIEDYNFSSFEPVSPETTTTYTLTCYDVDAGTNASKEAKVRVTNLFFKEI